MSHRELVFSSNHSLKILQINKNNLRVDGISFSKVPKTEQLHEKWAKNEHIRAFARRSRALQDMPFLDEYIKDYNAEDDFTSPERITIPTPLWLSNG